MDKAVSSHYTGDRGLLPRPQLTRSNGDCSMTSWGMSTRCLFAAVTLVAAGLCLRAALPGAGTEQTEHWAYQPIRPVPLPEVRDAGWCRSPVDRFILRRLEMAGIGHAPPADRATLCRRVYLDLLGIPPDIEQLEQFMQDGRPDAFERLVDRLLASPHYGERWARHWLDLVRFAETRGHEFDFDIHNAWRYRDYVIRAFNQDLPYERFVMEHVAGDLLDPPRRDPNTGLNESVVATAFWWLGEGKHSPVDVRREEADRIANQLDVFGKAFLAQTLVCARCHDHKFDPISTEDYYGLAGFLTSSRFQQAFLDPPQRIEHKVRRLDVLQQSVRESLLRVLSAVGTEHVASTLQAALKPSPGKSGETGADETDRKRPAVRYWAELLSRPEVQSVDHPLAVLAALAGKDQSIESALGNLATRWRAAHEGAGAGWRDVQVLFHYRDVADRWRGWSVTGHAFGGRVPRGTLVGVAADSGSIQLLLPGSLDSRRWARSLEGVVRSPSFRLRKRFIHVLAAGNGGRIHVILDGFVIIRNPIYGGLAVRVDAAEPRWYTIDVSMWPGHRVYLELLDSSMPTPGQPLPPEARAGRPRRDWIRVDAIVLSDQSVPPPLPPSETVREALDYGLTHPDRDRIATWFATRMVHSLTRQLRSAVTQTSTSVRDEALMANALLGALWIELPRLTDQLQELRTQYAEVERRIPLPARAPAMADGTAWDEYVFGRGLPENRGPTVPRRFLQIFGGVGPGPAEAGSGRLVLARQMVDPQRTPVLPRVIVNRIWQHHFGRGIVPTPDDFGRMGMPPTHPDLLDWLVHDFVRRGWSIKRLHRLMVLSATYRMASSPVPSADGADPTNRLFHRMSLRRMEAEVVRDSLLMLAGRLQFRLYGPSVLPYLSPFMEGRGRPAQSGPLDGNGRRTIYINVRRNFLSPMLLVFDYPVPFTTIGRRSVSNVPAQALTLMNSPFVVQQARRWAERVLNEYGDETDAELVRVLYQEAFARQPTDEELTGALAFLAEQAQGYGTHPRDPAVWADLCHVLVNAKEFIFIR